MTFDSIEIFDSFIFLMLIIYAEPQINTNLYKNTASYFECIKLGEYCRRYRFGI